MPPGVSVRPVTTHEALEAVQVLQGKPKESAKVFGATQEHWLQKMTAAYEHDRQTRRAKGVPLEAARRPESGGSRPATAPFVPFVPSVLEERLPRSRPTTAASSTAPITAAALAADTVDLRPASAASSAAASSAHRAGSQRGSATAALQLSLSTDRTERRAQLAAAKEALVRELDATRQEISLIDGGRVLVWPTAKANITEPIVLPVCGATVSGLSRSGVLRYPRTPSFG